MSFRVDEFFTFSDPTGDAAADLPITLQRIDSIGLNSSEEAVLIRMLLGTVNFTHEPTGRTWKQRQNHSVVGAPKVTIKGKKRIGSLLQAVDIDSGSLELYLKKSLRHRPYHRDILLEATHYFHRSEVNNHCNAFLHLYRLLERVSFVFPLIYASSTKDYKGSFEMLRDFFNGTGKGELGFFSRFLETTLDAALIESDSSLDFEGLGENGAKAAIRVMKRSISIKNIRSEGQTSITFSNRELLPLIINIRNWFFHFSSGQPSNITLSDLPDPDRFFLCINNLLFNWLSIVYFYVLRNQVDRYA